MTPERRRYATRQYVRAADGFETAAWKPPHATRFSPAAANDGVASRGLMDELRALPRWVVISTGGAFAALLGVMMGAAFSL